MRSAIMLIGLLALALATATASGSPSVCIAGETKAGGGKVIVNCGPAKATVRVGGKTYRFSQGLCQKLFGDYTVNIGPMPFLPQPRKLSFRFFNVSLPKARTGTYKPPSVNVSWMINIPGTTAHLDRGTVKLAKGLERGTFAGDVLIQEGSAAPKSVRGSGSWTC